MRSSAASVACLPIPRCACVLVRLIKGMKRRDRAIGTVTPPRRVAELVDSWTGEAHLVREDAVVSGRQSGRYMAVCGTVVLAASLTTPAQQYCRSCAQWSTR